MVMVMGSRSSEGLQVIVYVSCGAAVSVKEKQEKDD